MKIKFNTQKFGVLTFTNSIVTYEIPRVFLCKNKEEKYFVLNEFEETEHTSIYGICNLEECGISQNDYLNGISLCKINEHLDKLIYSYQIEYDYNTKKVIDEKSISPRKFQNGEFIKL